MRGRVWHGRQCDRVLKGVQVPVALHSFKVSVSMSAGLFSGPGLPGLHLEMREVGQILQEQSVSVQAVS